MTPLPATRQEAKAWYADKLAVAGKLGSDHYREARRWLARNDLFYLLVAVLKRADINHDWLFARCREVQADPNGHLDLWARDHRKSSIITFGLTIQDIINDPDVTVGIFSHSRGIAKQFLRQIKREFEANADLRELFPEIFWDNPQRDAPKWALAMDTPVLTVGGWKRHGDLVPGDKIFGSAGQIITVTGNSGPLVADCRRVRFDDCEMVASSDHLWAVECKRSTSQPWRDAKIEIKTTDELEAKTKKARLPGTPVVDLPAVDLPLDPYVLGL